jgi:hypothetical protein
MKNKELNIKKANRFKKFFRKQYISTMTSSQFKIPPDSKTKAEIDWIAISVIFDSTLDKFFGGGDWRGNND